MPEIATVPPMGSTPTGVFNVITIDGYQASGRTTLANRLEQAYGLKQLNLDLVLRRLAAAVHRTKLGKKALLDLAEEMPASEFLGGETSKAMKGPEVTGIARKLFLEPKLAELLTRRFATLAATEPGLVAVGTSMGRVVFPDAPVQFFLDAKMQERVLRTCRTRKARVDDSYCRTLIEEDDMAMLMGARGLPWQLYPNGDAYRDAPIRKLADYKPGLLHPQLYIHTDSIGADAVAEVAMLHVEQRLPGLKPVVKLRQEAKPVEPG